MDNQPSDMRPFETDEASQATKPTDEEIEQHIERTIDVSVWEFHDVEIVDNSCDSVTVAIYVEIPWGEIER